MIKSASIQKAKQQATHEFFPRNKVPRPSSNETGKVASSSSGFIFNKAPINKRDAFLETKTKVITQQDDLAKQNAQIKSNPKLAAAKGSFLHQLYRDDDEYDELKVHGLVDEDDDQVQEARNLGSTLQRMAKRKTKVLDKMGSKQLKTSYSQQIDTQASRIGRIALRKGSLGLFAVCEIGQDYLIVNHTRNIKGYVALKGTGFKGEEFKVGQLLVAAVTAEIGGAQTDNYNFQSGKAGLNKKIQLSLDIHVINKQLSTSLLTKSMSLQAKIESKEAKGYIIDLGLKDQTKGFLKFNDSLQNNLFKKGQMVQVMVKNVIEQSKVAKCELISALNCGECVQQADKKLVNGLEEINELTVAQIKPGFLVSAKISKLYENGIELTYLGGLTATCFADHLAAQNAVSDYKIGQKVLARVISVDSLSKKICVSLKNNIVNWIQAIEENPMLQKFVPGLQFEKVKVSKQIYGGSYLVQLDAANKLIGFLHKSQTKEQTDANGAALEDQEASSDDEAGLKKAATQKKQIQQDSELQEGQLLESVKIKEINYFDGLPILSIRRGVLLSQALSYHSLSAGTFVQAKIEKVNADKNYITLSINEFVKGSLHIEHMSDNPLKMMPPKFLEVGKEIRVRVFNVDPSSRSLEFTKKDSLMKEDTPVFQSYKEVKKGDKLLGVVVSETEHGYVVRFFGGLKGLLTFEDIKQKYSGSFDAKEFKVGKIVKAYVLFKKKDKGIALTLSKKKAKAGLKENGSAINGSNLQTMETQYFPSEDSVEAFLVNGKYSTLAKASRNPKLVGSIYEFRVVQNEETKPYLLVKSTNAEKKSLNILAVLPRCLITNHPLAIHLPMEAGSEATYQGIVMDILYNQIPLVSFQPELIQLNEQILSKEKLKDQQIEVDQQLPVGATYIGIVNGITDKSGCVSVRFFDGIQKSIKVKDLNSTVKYQEFYSIGKIIRVAVNKLGRLCTKDKVVQACLSGLQQDTDTDAVAQIKSFCFQYGQSHKDSGLKIGQLVLTNVQLVKDYGLIVKFENNQAPEGVKTGFIINDQKSQLKYKQSQEIQCLVLDVDPVKEIADLSEKLASFVGKAGEKEIKEGIQVKAIVELNKEAQGYIIVSLKGIRSKIGIFLLNNLSLDEKQDSSLQLGNEVDVKVVGKSQSGLLELIRVSTKKVNIKQSASKQLIELNEGIKFTGQVKSIKNQCLYLQVPSVLNSEKGQACIGRLHMIECQSVQEFNQYAIGDRVESKILKVTKDRTHNRTWIELTRNKIHMQKLQGLDADQLLKTCMSEEDLKIGEKYESILVSSSWNKEEPVNMGTSQPIQIQISPFVRGTIPFNHIVGTEELVKFGSQIFLGKKYQVGNTLSAIYLGKGQFSLLEKNAVDKILNGKVTAPIHKKGDLLTARFVSVVKGRGITVQLDEKTFGFIEVSEITDELCGNVFKQVIQRAIFPARVIDIDKDGKIQLSSRESVVDEVSWKQIRPEGTTIRFQECDSELQEKGNQRNKILKYGANVAIQRGELALGYIVNIGKAGCFISIGHNCVVRAGLNDLSDQSGFNFQEEMPIGRMVLGRITKVEQLPTGENRFNYSTRQSLVVYGVGVIDRSKLEVGNEVTSIVMAVAEGKAFAQIKGSYIKIKVKGYKEKDQIQVGDHIISSLQKVTKDKISSSFVSKTGSKGLSLIMNDKEKDIQRLFNTIRQEAEQELESIRAVSIFKQDKGDFDACLIQPRNFNSKDEQIAQQIQDLKDLEKESGEDIDIDSQDSDAEEMRRLITYDQESQEEGEEAGEQEIEASEFDTDESQEDEVESNQQAQEQIHTQSEISESSENDDQKLNKKKRTLKDRLREEQDIRDKEKKMRSDTNTPKDIDDFERLLVANQDQSYVWIQYMAFMLDNAGVEAARKVAERATKSVSMSNEHDKLNIWTAFMNLESNFGTQESLEACTRRALEINDRKKVYLNLIEIYKSNMKFEYTEAIYKQLSKKYSNNLDVWSAYLEFLVDIKCKQEDDKEFLLKDLKFSDPKSVLQRALQALTKDQHVNMISKYGILEFKHGSPENGRTMFEGIVNNYPKRMDIWSIYMDMETKYGQNNVTQARHLFERCLNNQSIAKKPKKMKLVFQKYMEYENKLGNKNNLQKLRERVEEYLGKIYNKEEKEDEVSSEEDNNGDKLMKD